MEEVQPRQREASDEVETEDLPEEVDVKPTLIMPERSRKAEDIDLKYAVLVWNGIVAQTGRKPKIESIESIFGLNNHQARKLISQIERMAEDLQSGGNGKSDTVDM
jgi:hypothetical protein